MRRHTSLPRRTATSDLIAHHFLHNESEKQGRSFRGFTTDALSAISEHPWPGNIRELQNRLRRAVLTATGHHITAADLEFASAEEDTSVDTLKECRERAERLALTRAMHEADGNVSKMAKLLDTSRPTVYQLLQRYDIEL